MNDFDDGFIWGRLFVSWIINDDFFGIAIRIGKEYEIYEDIDVYHITMTFESLLPNSLNSHIFRYTADCPMRNSVNETDIGNVIENLFGKV